ncbi:MAG: hypothetical protein IH944_14290 [Armatimonadetes bacterium]|nr:hypothetical protein [Armatimonadota bacterium]
MDVILTRPQLQPPFTELHDSANNGSTGFASFAAVPSNLGAIEAGIRFATGTTPLVALVGSPGWGKSHLLQCIYAYMVLQGRDVKAPMSATVFASGKETEATQGAILLDDAQDAVRNLRTKNEFRRLLELRVRTGRPTLIALSLDDGLTEIRQFLPSPKEWGVQTIDDPNVSEREAIVRQIASDERLALSSPVVHLLSRHLCGNGRSIRGALRTLKLEQQDWSLREHACAACGVLMPYLSGRDGWDVRDLAAEAVSRTLDQRPDPGVSHSHLCAYMMLIAMKLNEADAAAFLGQSPSSVYGMSSKVRRMLTDSGFAETVNCCRRELLRLLETA